MDVREKLIHLVKNALRAYGNDLEKTVEPYEFIADFLIHSGVTVQELDGCEYCKEDNEGYRKMFGAFSLENPFHGKTWKICAGKCKPMEIYFCPMCGRRLTQPPKGE